MMYALYAGTGVGLRTALCYTNVIFVTLRVTYA